MQTVSNDGWPLQYIPDTTPSPHRRPGIGRPVIREDIAPVVAARFLDDSSTFAQRYRDIVVTADHDHKDHAVDYLDLLLPSIIRGGGDFSVANEHDFANIHHAVWLLIYESIVRLLNFNIHGDWGDPPQNGTTHGEDFPPVKVPGGNLFRFHDVPNTTGYYAVSTTDFTAPDLGVGQAAPAAAAAPVQPAGQAMGDVKPVAFAVARKMVAEADYGESYLRVVKSFYQDRLNHTQDYARIINQALATGAQVDLDDDDVANVHRATWLLLVNRFSMLVGTSPFGPLESVTQPTRSLPMPNTLGGRRIFEIPNKDGSFTANLGDVDN